jgi:hypothetical protein
MLSSTNGWRLVPPPIRPPGSRPLPPNRSTDPDPAEPSPASVCPARSRPSHNWPSRAPAATQRAGPIFLARHIPHRPEPRHQRLPGVLDNGTRGGRDLTSAAAALEQSVTDHNRLPPLTARTSKSAGPSQADQVGPTVFFRREATQTPCARFLFDFLLPG